MTGTLQADCIVTTIDLETLATDRDAVIASIGAISHHVGTGRVIGELYLTVDCESQGNRSRDEPTREFWLDQSQTNQEAFRLTFGGTERASLPDALVKLREYIEAVSVIECRHAPRIMGNGPEFDCEILADAYTSCGMALPWRYWNQISMRSFTTLARLLELELAEHPGVIKHFALHDARTEAFRMQEILHLTRMDIFPSPDPVQFGLYHASLALAPQLSRNLDFARANFYQQKSIFKASTAA